MTRVRFAPSPTGFLHLGGVRTALFNWLFARRHQGKFILRIEDTDKVRSKKIYLDQILQDLQWLGLCWDEGPYFQSKRLKLYRQSANKLVKEGRAYNEGQAVVLKLPDKTFEFTDLIRGPIKFSPEAFKDQVLIKSDGTPTYNFACCLDDHDMRISHVIRGEDHISNTPKQIAIYEALGFEPPQFAHIPLIVTEDRARLSKRKGAMPVSYYREQGYLPEALFNFLALLGWSPDDDREILSQQEVISRFSLEGVGKAAAYFNPEKLEWMNGQYIQSADAKELTKQIMPFLQQKKYISKDYDQRRLTEIVELFKPRMKMLSQFCEQADFFFQEKINFTQEAKSFLLTEKKTKEIFNELVKVLEKTKTFDAQTIENDCRGLIAQKAIKAPELIHPVRVALTGKRAGPGLFETMAALGKERVLARLRRAIKIMG